MRKSLLGVLSLATMVAFSAPVFAQSTSNGTGTSNVSTSANQQAQSTNAGVQAQVYQYGANHVHESVNSQVPLSIVGYGSFSQNGCTSSVGLGATTKIFSLVYNAPTPELNCQHAVRSDEFGRESQLAHSEAKPIQAEMLRAISVWESCTSDDETTAACIRMGAIAYVDPSHPDIHQTKPNPHYNETANSIVLPAPTAPASRPVAENQRYNDSSSNQPTSFAWQNQAWANGGRHD